MNSLELQKNIRVILETSDYLVIEKPSGLVVHPDGKSDEATLCDWIMQQYPDLVDVGESMQIEHGEEHITIARPGIVHRLDRETSGVMVIAKTQAMFEHLKQQFQDHTIRKQYIAIVSGWMRDDRGLIDVSIGRSATDIRRFAAGTRARGTIRDARTRYVVAERFVGSDNVRYAVMNLYPETGRTHQLRVHMKHVGHPIIGDRVYAPRTMGSLGAERTMLHAVQITFADLAGKPVTAHAAMPADMSAVISKR